MNRNYEILVNMTSKSNINACHFVLIYILLYTPIIYSYYIPQNTIFFIKVKWWQSSTWAICSETFERSQINFRKISPDAFDSFFFDNQSITYLFSLTLRKIERRKKVKNEPISRMIEHFDSANDGITSIRSWISIRFREGVWGRTTRNRDNQLAGRETMKGEKERVWEEANDKWVRHCSVALWTFLFPEYRTQSDTLGSPRARI